MEGGAKVGGCLVSPLAWTMGAVGRDLGLPVTVLEMIRGRMNPFRGWLSGPRPGWSKYGEMNPLTWGGSVAVKEALLNTMD